MLHGEHRGQSKSRVEATPSPLLELGAVPPGPRDGCTGPIPPGLGIGGRADHVVFAIDHPGAST